MLVSLSKQEEPLSLLEHVEQGLQAVLGRRL